MSAACILRSRPLLKAHLFDLSRQWLHKLLDHLWVTKDPGIVAHCCRCCICLTSTPGHLMQAMKGASHMAGVVREAPNPKPDLICTRHSVAAHPAAPWWPSQLQQVTGVLAAGAYCGSRGGASWQHPHDDQSVVVLYNDFDCWISLTYLPTATGTSAGTFNKSY